MHKGDVCLSIGGDNYCYGQEGNRILGYYNRMLRSRGAKTVLWGCSVEPEAMTPAVVEDMRRYSLITARESLTYAALKSAGLTRVCLVPDPAFQLDPEETPLPGALRRGQTVGINVSPLAAGYGSLVLDNYRALVRYILKETDLDVLLLPHVVKKETDDRTVLRDLLNEFGASPRFAMAEDQSCMKLKGMISRCRFFVGPGPTPRLRPIPPVFRPWRQAIPSRRGALQRIFSVPRETMSFRYRALLQRRI